MSETELSRRIACGDTAAFEALMRQHNQKLYRVARAILKDDAEAEDALQDAYLSAYNHIGGFQGQAKLSTWLTRIVINEALGRLRKRKRERVVIPFAHNESDGGDAREGAMAEAMTEAPESAILRAEMRRLLELKIDELPVAFRTVFMLRGVEEMSVEETTACLSIPDATVRTRLFRAKALLRESLAREIDLATEDVFGFAGERCDRIVAMVIDRLRVSRSEREPDRIP